MKTPKQEPGRKGPPASRNFFERHRFLTGLLVTVITLVVIGVVAEVGLRIVGYKPYTTHYKLVDRLEVYDQFYTDETGILKMDPSYYAEARGCSINSDGFRDDEIQDQLLSGRPRIMFVGDSFTFGASAEPITNCFADVIEESGYTGFNFGVAGTGPVQYATVAERYVPVVKPDMIAVMVFLGNDLNRYPQKVTPYKLTHYGTNAGMIYAFDANGNHMTAEEAHEYYYGDLLKKVEYFSRKSVVVCMVGKALVGLRHKYLMRRHRASADAGETDRNQYVIDSLARIRQVADEYKARCCCFLIPVRPSIRHKLNRFEDVRYVFSGLDYVHVGFDEDEYQSGADPHFNNAGHKKMASIIRDVFEDPKSSLINRD